MLSAKYAKSRRTKSRFDEFPEERKRNLNTKIATLCAAAVLILIACLAVACGGGAEPTKPVPTASAPPLFPHWMEPRFSMNAASGATRWIG